MHTTIYFIHTNSSPEGLAAMICVMLYVAPLKGSFAVVVTVAFSVKFTLGRNSTISKTMDLLDPLLLMVWVVIW